MTERKAIPPLHMWVSGSDGALYDTRRDDWSARPLRPIYRRHYREFDSDPTARSQQVRATLRAGPYAWPGGYGLMFAVESGVAVCFDCLRKEWSRYARDIRDRDAGWSPYGLICAAELEEPEADLCDDCGRSLAEI